MSSPGGPITAVGDCGFCTTVALAVAVQNPLPEIVTEYTPGMVATMVLELAPVDHRYCDMGGPPVTLRVDKLPGQIGGADRKSVV